jgi:transcriptional regulator with GAF, ATPase, and Fis domain
MPGKADNTPVCVDISGGQFFVEKIGRFSALVQSYAYPEEVPCFIFTDLLPPVEKIRQIIQKHFAAQHHQRPFIIVTERQNRSCEQYWDLLANGLTDIIEWTNEEELLQYGETLLNRTRQINDVLYSPLVKKNLVGESEAWKTFLREVIEVALFSQTTVLLIGESGTGKELVSRLIHTIDTRPEKKDLVLLDCTTVVPELAGSEFFGHEKGSYTNALQKREGAFALADGGTLFLDEIGELPLPLQSELLRVIQEGSYKKVGSNIWQKTDFRLVCATNRQLRVAVADARFRQDLYFRISDFECQVPALKERVEDIPILARHFLQDLFPAGNCPEMDDAVIEYLVKRDYPGNVRELRQLVKRIALRHVRPKKITIGEIPPQDRPASGNTGNYSPQEFELATTLRKAILGGSKLRDLKDRTMDEAIKIALEICKGDKSLAAQKLGVTLRAIQQFRSRKSVN